MRNSLPSAPRNYLSFPLRVLPGLTCTVLSTHIAKAVLPTLQIIVLAKFIDSAMLYFSSGVMSWNLTELLLGFILIIIAERLLDIVERIVSASFQIKLTSEFDLVLLRKRSRIQYSQMEKNETNDLIDRTAQDSGKIVNGFYNYMALIECIIRTLGIIVTTMSYCAWAGLLVLLAFVVIIPVSKKCGEANYHAYEEANKQFRYANYIRQILSRREFVEERTLFNYSDEVNHKWEQTHGEGCKIMRAANKKNTARSKLSTVCIVLISALFSVIVIFPVYTGEITEGLYISLLTAITQLIAMFTWNLSVYLEDYEENRCYLMDLHDFFLLAEISPQKVCCNQKTDVFSHIERIEFSNVSFQYSGNDVFGLKNISFVLESGKVYGFVGENGSGKSTIMKLLLGLYEDYGGTILINDIDIRTLCEQQRHKLFSVVYQDFAKYQLSIWDNLTIGCENPPSQEDIEHALAVVGLSEKIKSLPKGLDTQIGHLGQIGWDISGGEWQRISIARAMLRNAPIQILDEPTASLDPIHERELYEQFCNARHGDICILITHRFGGIKDTDCIFVLDHGEIIESGSHRELLERDGSYAAMYHTQCRWYQ